MARHIHMSLENLEMRMIVVVLVLALTACATPDVNLQREPDGTLAVSYLPSMANSPRIVQLASGACHQLETAPHLDEPQARGNRLVTKFECRIPSQLGGTPATNAVPWQADAETQGVLVDCHIALSHCYNRLAMVCPDGYTIAQQTMRGAVQPVLGTTVISGPTTVAVANGPGATAVATSTQSPFMVGAQVGSMMRANADRQSAIFEASKEYGKVWAVCS